MRRLAHGGPTLENRALDDHVVSALGGFDPEVVARNIVRRPALYFGAPATFERATAVVAGIDKALLLDGQTSPLTERPTIASPAARTWRRGKRRLRAPRAKDRLTASRLASEPRTEVSKHSRPWPMTNAPHKRRL